jgi:hypothetical protein
VLKDLGGELLDRSLKRRQGQPPDLNPSLRTAVSLTTALGRLLRRGLIPGIRTTKVVLRSALVIVGGMR